MPSKLDWRRHLKTEPFKHQITGAEFIVAREKSALLMEMGTGKTLSLILAALHLKAEGTIDGLVLVCPKPLMQNERVEFIRHAKDADSYSVFICEPSTRLAAIKAWAHELHSHRLAVLIINYDGLLSEPTLDSISDVMRTMNIMVACDESTKIKNNNSQRSKEACVLGALAKIRLIMTGSPVTERPTDAYGQFRFLDPRPISYSDPNVGIFGSSWWAFRGTYCVMGGYGGHQVVSYKNMEQFKERMLRHSFRVEKKDCLDLPEKIYEARKFEMPKEMAEVYDAMAKELFWVTEDNEEFEATIALTKFMRLKEITSGYIKQGDRIRRFKENPKIDMVKEIIEESTAHKVIVWCREREEIKLVSEAIGKSMPTFELHGGTKDKQLTVETFKHNKDRSVLVGQVQTGGMGFTITEATLVIYMSNDFTREIRSQSEDRCHRVGQRNPVTYVDLIAKNSVDEYTMQVLAGKAKMAASLTNAREAVYWGKEGQETWEETEF